MDKFVFRQVPVISRADMLSQDLALPRRHASISVRHKNHPGDELGRAWLFTSEDKLMVTADIFIDMYYMSALVGNGYPHIRRTDDLSTIESLILQPTPAFNYTNPMRLYQTDVTCDCGAGHTSFPQIHLWFCSIERHKRGEK